MFQVQKINILSFVFVIIKALDSGKLQAQPNQISPKLRASHVRPPSDSRHCVETQISRGPKAPVSEVRDTSTLSLPFDCSKTL